MVAVMLQFILRAVDCCITYFCFMKIGPAVLKKGLVPRFLLIPL